MPPARSLPLALPLLLFAVAAPLSTSVGNITCGLIMAAALVQTVATRKLDGLPPRLVVASLAAFLALNALATLLADPLPVRWDRYQEELWHKPLLLAVPLLAAGVPHLVERAVKLLVIVGSVVTIYAFVQHFTGIDFVRHGTTIAEGDRYLAYGFFDHHLTYGGHVLLLLVFAGAWALHGEHARFRDRLLPLICAGMLGLALLWSFARSAQLGGFVAAVFLVLVLRGRARAWAGAGLAGAVLAAAAIPSVRQRLGKILVPDSESTRLNLWQSSLDGIAEKPLLGWGRANFGEMLARHQVDGFYESTAHAHNDYLQQAVNAGLLGLLAFLVLLVGVAVLLWRGRQAAGSRRWLLLGGVATVLAIGVAGVFQVYQTDDEVEMVLYFLLGCSLAVQVASGRAGPVRRIP